MSGKGMEITSERLEELKAYLEDALINSWSNFLPTPYIRDIIDVIAELESLRMK